MSKSTSSIIGKTRALAIVLRDGGICQYCGVDCREQPINGKQGLTLDHIICRAASKAQGLEPDHSNENLIVACRACNSGRQDRSVEEFATPGALLRIAHQVKQPVNLTLAAALLSGEITAN